MYERILLMGGPGSGKSYQLLRICDCLKEQNIRVHCLDLEDKLEAMLTGLGGKPPNMNLQIATSWEEIKLAQEEMEKTLKPNEWIFVDRVDLSWPGVQRWFTQQRYKEELADRLLRTAERMKGSQMVMPRFDKGSWQVINEAYESFMLKILYKSKCNIVFTSGIKGVEEDSPLDVFGNLGVLPRGQKELAHQPHSVFLLTQRKERGNTTWHIQTAKDIPNRIYFEGEELFDFSLQYLAGVKK